MKKNKNQIWKGIVRFIDRIFGLVLAAGIVLGIFGLALEWILLKGPSPELRDSFVMTMLQTRRFGFIPHVFLTDEEVTEIFNSHFEYSSAVKTDPSLITINTEKPDPNQGPQPDAYGLVDEDGDGVIVVEVKKKGFVGTMMVVKDPSRVFVGKPDVYGGYGMTLDALCEKYDAIGGINGGAFFDEDGGGTGGFPDGLTIVNKEVFMVGMSERTFVGFTEDNILFVGGIDRTGAEAMHIRDGVSFGPALIVNGQGAYDKFMESGINPRTAIGQRADGAVLMLVIDGRQMHSVGCSFGDVRDVMFDFGAVNACNLDGGSSTVMYYNGEIINSPSSASGTSRTLPDAFLFR